MYYRSLGRVHVSLLWGRDFGGRSAAEREGEGSDSCTSSNLMLSPLSPQSYQLQL